MMRPGLGIQVVGPRGVDDRLGAFLDPGFVHRPASAPAAALARIAPSERMAKMVEAALGRLFPTSHGAKPSAMKTIDIGDLLVAPGLPQQSPRSQLSGSPF